MATPTADTSEIRRKGRQRLIGAITIVLLLVVFVPMLLDPQPKKEGKDAELAIPAKEGAAPLPAPAPAKPSEPPAAATLPSDAKPAATVEAKPALADTNKASVPPRGVAAPRAEVAKAEPAPPVTPAKTAAAAPPKGPPKLEGFAIQVGAFGDEEKLRQAREKLAAAKITHFIERLPNGLTRLRAGPYGTRDEAEKATAAVKTAGLDGKVVPLP